MADSTVGLDARSQLAIDLAGKTQGNPGLEKTPARASAPAGMLHFMTRKQKEANVRRAMAAGRRPRPTSSERIRTDRVQGELGAEPGPIDALNELEEARVTSPRGA